jgi:sugar transferase (PEP-CTERM/EpsH1 system associated)
VHILLLTQVVPFPPDSGPKIKTYHVLRYLAERHRVHLVTFVRSEAEAASAAALQPLCSGVTTVPLQRSRARDLSYLARSLVTGRPFLVERDDSARMHATVQELVRHQGFHAVHADQLSMAQFAVELPRVLRVLDEHNAVWTILRRAARQERWGPHRSVEELEWRKLRSYEGEMCRRFDRVTLVSDEDRADLEDAAGGPFSHTVIPITTDIRALPFRPRTADAHHVVSVATMFYLPNVEGVHWFATEVFPLVRRDLPDCEFRIVGSRPPRRISQLAVPGSGIVVTGYVEHLDPILDESGVLVVPVRVGSGIRVKILEAFARGIPVVSTSIGVEGIAARHQEHLLVADTPRDFADGVVRLLRDRSEAMRLARAARALVESRYDWRTGLAELDEIYPPDLVASQGAAQGQRASSRE